MAAVAERVCARREPVVVAVARRLLRGGDHLDASSGHRSAVSTRKGGAFYGYKVHAAVCTATGLPVAWTVATARDAEQTFALGLIDATKARGFNTTTTIMHKGYDTGPIHDGCMDRGVYPVMPLRETPAPPRKPDGVPSAAPAG